ncbi:hypothetical protein D3C73_1012500 [compost metagenome]
MPARNARQWQRPQLQRIEQHPALVYGLRGRVDAARIVIALQHDAFAHQQPTRQQRLFHQGVTKYSGNGDPP